MKRRVKDTNLLLNHFLMFVRWAVEDSVTPGSRYSRTNGCVALDVDVFIVTTALNRGVLTVFLKSFQCAPTLLPDARSVLVLYVRVVAILIRVKIRVDGADVRLSRVLVLFWQGRATAAFQSLR